MKLSRAERRPKRGSLRLLGWVLLVLLAWPGIAAAELRRVEAVGIYGIRDALRTRVIPRDEAIARARREGVSRVALELMADSGFAGPEANEPSPGPELERVSPDEPEPEEVADQGIETPLEQRAAAGEGAGDASLRDTEDVRLEHESPSRGEAELLRSALGTDMLPYTRSYRILEDQGELPVLFDDQPGVETEYVVVVEVIVDVKRIEEALKEAGLVVRAAEFGGGRATLTLEMTGLGRFDALQTVLEALRGPLGATRVEPSEFQRERQLLLVEGPFDLIGLARRLATFEHPRLVLEPVGFDRERDRLRVLARWFPADTLPEEEPALAESGESVSQKEEPTDSRDRLP